MTIDEQLIRKMYYKTIVEGKEDVHPIKALGELYMEEQQKAISDLSLIRFAQAEVYFHHSDFEAAIFKWENINNELEPWAKKNMADAYFKLEILTTAEELYQSIQSDSGTLKIEVLLQLFSVYVALGKLDLAVEAIKEAVALNPDYPNVTSIAKDFFEKHQDWKNAIELSVNEGIRTGDLFWFDTLQTYAEEGKVRKIEPDYFTEAFVALFKADLARFEKLAVALWKHYQHGELYFTWIKEFNHILLHMEGGSTHTWKELSVVYHDTYFELINGKKLIREISHLIPNHLSNWVKIADSSFSLMAAASALAWSEIFPTSIEHSSISLAEKKISESLRYGNGLEDGFQLFKSVITWARQNGIEIGYRFEWMVKELLDLRAPYLLIAGAAGNEKSGFMNELIGEKVINDSISSTIFFKDDQEMELREISDEGERELAHLSDIDESTQTVILYKKPMSILHEKQLAFIQTPGISGVNRFRNDVFQYLQFADSLLFVLNAKKVLTEDELEILVKIREQAPDLPIHFLLNEAGPYGLNQDVIDLAASKVNTYFPKAQLFAFSGRNEHLDSLAHFLVSIGSSKKLEEKRTSKVQHYIRKTIKFLLERRVEMENGYIESIKWNEDMVTKLSGATNQLRDLEEDKIRIMKKSFTKIKDDIKLQLMQDIPELLKDSSDLIDEESDFGKVHIHLNAEMNNRIRQHLNETILPVFHTAIHQWIDEATGEFNGAQGFLNEMGAGFNELYEEDKLILACDFKVLDDWRRDADRMTRGNVQLENINILNRFTPSQFLLKSAGRLLGALQQNKSLIYTKYKQYIENEDYSEAAEEVAEQFFHPFELFEKSIDRDVSMFFSPPITELQEAVSESGRQIEESKVSLQEIRENPELYRDPITLFQLKLLQLEWMTTSDEEIYQKQ
ncbi:GTP-binding protein [Bacillus sp. S/N-304-OC-R1]|uniref:GTP-binding protein n=1 Tax=Bacillus sp. S/N-304-OC-R1 TaxID=2758034 RepID=UPI001C8D68ED|nr:GTP-binding protein [Bacillus sp. S/N-304-OC-R1]MBY0122061.1 GTP-binding protein [Bacillus sp. S/N-304-OC-R1]